MPTSDEQLDFSELSDDQVVELATALAREAMRRNPALQAAFAQSILDERERLEAAARGSHRVKKAEAEKVERQAQSAAVAQAQERERLRVHSALLSYLHAGAKILGLPPRDIALIWDLDPLQARGKAPKLRLNLVRQKWSFVEYEVSASDLHTTPGLRKKRAALLPWCREVSAAAMALEIKKSVIIRGDEA